MVVAGRSTASLMGAPHVTGALRPDHRHCGARPDHAGGAPALVGQATVSPTARLVSNGSRNGRFPARNAKRRSRSAAPLRAM